MFHFIVQIIVLWASDTPKPPPSRWALLGQGVPLHIVVPQKKQNIGERFRFTENKIIQSKQLTRQPTIKNYTIILIF